METRIRHPTMTGLTFPPHDSNRDTHRVHGLGTHSMQPDWPPLTRAEVAAVLAHYPQTGFGADIRWRSPRPLSAAARVKTAAGEVFVKRHHRSVRTPAVLHEEHAFMRHLTAAGAPVPVVFNDDAGNSAHGRGAWTYEVHALAPGRDLYRDAMSWTPPRCTAHAVTAGRTLAELHDAAAGYSAPQRSTHMLVTRSDIATAGDPADALARQLPRCPALRDWLARRDWRRELTEALGAAPDLAAIARQPRLWTHNDWHLSNLFWSEPGAHAEVTAVLDFGLASRTCALFDLATAIERNAIEWLALDKGHAAAHADVACALIDGYRQHRPLDADKVRLLTDLLPRVHLDFAVSEVEYFLVATGSLAHAEIAWTTFLCGHATWFQTEPGRALLNVIRNHTESLQGGSSRVAGRAAGLAANQDGC